MMIKANVTNKEYRVLAKASDGTEEELVIRSESLESAKLKIPEGYELIHIEEKGAARR